MNPRAQIWMRWMKRILLSAFLLAALLGGWRVVQSWRGDDAFEQAVAALRAGRTTDAADAIGALRRINPGDRRLPGVQGDLELARGRAPSARSLFEDAVRSDPVHAESWAQLGYLRALAGDAPGAQEALERALKLDPRSWQAHHHLGEMAAMRGDAAAATMHLRADVDLRPPEQRSQAEAENRALLLRYRLAVASPVVHGGRP